MGVLNPKPICPWHLALTWLQRRREEQSETTFLTGACAGGWPELSLAVSSSHQLCYWILEFTDESIDDGEMKSVLIKAEFDVGQKSTTKFLPYLNPPPRPVCWQLSTLTTTLSSAPHRHTMMIIIKTLFPWVPISVDCTALWFLPPHPPQSIPSEERSGGQLYLDGFWEFLLSPGG